MNKAAQPATLAERRKAETRAQLVAAAAEVFAEKGYHDTRIADIVSRLGAGQGTFYRYFDSKRQVLEAILESKIERMIAPFAGLNAPAAIGSLAEYRDRAGDILDQVFALLDHETDTVQLLLVQAPSVDPQIGSMLLAVTDTLEAMVVDYYGTGIERGYFRPDLDVASAARATLGLGMSALLTLVKHPGDDGVRRAYRTVVLDFIVRFAGRD
ncbi:TetR/AcrR family transcriptional regulator [Antrihabitans sp. YC2-6]|uniref:TetR/AcrR family transcriptional regulator n=1 Tax=Antrihabitans sp. YC2-6 TaxID=2799498 RepID=UPI0018F7137A|nr:TetR/AcrR family transcriptional regulator [Antrihabitans sp. YC2-6]MBJ8344055.1 TetR/AcrR family transcriptional regulator [Antrihabitans sp. YC2-6]